MLVGIATSCGNKFIYQRMLYGRVRPFRFRFVHGRQLTNGADRATLRLLNRRRVARRTEEKGGAATLPFFVYVFVILKLSYLYRPRLYSWFIPEEQNVKKTFAFNDLGKSSILVEQHAAPQGRFLVKHKKMQYFGAHRLPQRQDQCRPRTFPP